MIKILCSTFAAICLMSSGAFAEDVSYTREPENPLYKKCSSADMELQSQQACKKEYTREIISHCYAEAKHAVGKEKCIGKGSLICLVVSQYADTLNINACIKNELTVWEEIQEAEYEIARAWATDRDDKYGTHFDDPKVQYSVLGHLDKSQKDWLAFRDSKCRHILAIYLGGTARGAKNLSCKNEVTAIRAIYFNDLNDYYIGR